MIGAILLSLAALADPAPVVEGDVTEAHVAGMTVIVKHVANAELVTAQLYLRGGARNWTKADAGVETLALNVAAAGGTLTLDKIAFTQKLAGLGATIDADTGRDWSLLQAKGPVASFDPLFGLLVDVLLRPALPPSEIELQRQRQIQQIKHDDEDPDGRLMELIDGVVFKGHPYEARAEGTVDVVTKLNPAQLGAQLQKLRETSRMVLVVVGDVDATKVIGAARAAFALVPRGDYAAKALATPSFAGATLTTEERKLPTNYIVGLFPVAPAAAKDAFVGPAMWNILWERLFEEVRTKRNLSYAPGIRTIITESVSLAGVYVTATDPNTTLPVMIHELKRMQDEPLDATDLAATKALTRTGMLVRQETTDGQATALARGWLLTGDWRYDAKLRDQIANATSADLQAYARKYFGKMQMVLLGDPQKLEIKIVKSF